MKKEKNSMKEEKKKNKDKNRRPSSQVDAILGVGDFEPNNTNEDADKKDHSEDDKKTKTAEDD